MSLCATALVVLVTLQNQKLPPFPVKQAKWVVSGSVHAHTMLAQRKVDIPAGFRHAFPGGVTDESRLCRERDLALPNVLVSVVGLERRWVMPSTFQWVELRIRKDGNFRPRTVGVMKGDRLKVRNELPGWCPVTDPQSKRLAKLMGAEEPLRLPVHLRLDDRLGHRISTSMDFWVLLYSPERSGGFIPAHGVAAWRVRSSYVLTGRRRKWLRCNVHMLPHSRFAVTGADGKFRLPPLPPGEYRIRARHELLGEVTQKVLIRGRNPDAIRIDFPVPEPLQAPPPKKRKP